MLTKEFIEKYFLTEKQDGLMLMIAGTIAIGLAIFLLLKGSDSFSKGASISLIVTGLWQITAGYPGFMHSDAHRIEMIYAYDMNPSLLKNEETQRVNNVLKRMRMARIVEVVLFVIGGILCTVFFRQPERYLFFGIGAGLSLQVLLIFILDFFASRRTEQYWFYLKTFVANHS